MSGQQQLVGLLHGQRQLSVEELDGALETERRLSRGPRRTSVTPKAPQLCSPFLPALTASLQSLCASPHPAGVPLTHSSKYKASSG